MLLRTPIRPALHRFPSLVIACIALPHLLTGCGAGVVAPIVSPTQPSAAAHVGGRVLGGQQPINGAVIQLYLASTTNIRQGQAATALLTGAAVLTAPDGTFSIASRYTCPSATSQVYLVAAGGNPGLAAGANNANSVLMAAIGNCGDLAGSKITINEITTAATTAALVPFMTSYAAVGSTPAGAQAMAADFSLVKNLVNIQTGTSPGAVTSPSFSVDAAKLDSLADIVSDCVNSAGHASAGDGSPCGNLLNAATPINGTAATNVADALLAVAENPAQNVNGLYSLLPSYVPFVPALTSAPADWSLLPQNVLVEPPITVSLSLDTQPGTNPLGNVKTIAWDDPKVLWAGGVQNCGPGQYPDDLAGCSRYVSNDAGEVNAYVGVQDATDFYIFIKGNGNVPYRIFIDGVDFNPLGINDAHFVAPPADGNFYNLHLVWSGRGSHQIRFENIEYVFGFGVDTQGQFVASTNALGHRFEVLGDSFVEPAYDFVGFAQLLGDPTGWEMFNSGNGGTGLIATNPLSSRGNYQSRVQTDVCALYPDYLIIYGSTNDDGYTAAEEQSAAHTLVTSIQACSPATDIILMGPICPESSNCTASIQLASGLKAAATAAGLNFIDPIAEVWIPTAEYYLDYCTGTQGSNCPADFAHPTQAGHQAIANHLLSDLRTLRPRWF